MTPYSFVYGLAEPDTDFIRYIGQSVHPKKRLAEHISFARFAVPIKPLDTWLLNLRAAGQRPALIILGCFTLQDALEHELRYFYALRESNNLLNLYKPSGIGFTGATLNYSVECIETSERFVSAAAAARAFGYSEASMQYRHVGSRTKGVHFRRLGREEGDRSMRAPIAYLRAIGKKGGSVKSDMKTEAARENGKKGGRPRGSKTRKKSSQKAK